MPRFEADDSLYDDPAVSRAGTAAMGLYFRCGVYVARHLLDGHVPSEVAALYGTPEWTRKLTDAGLWETEPGGHYMPRYLVDNPAREKVLAIRKLKAERQQRWLENRRNAMSGQRRVSRRSSRASSGTSRDGPQDGAQPPSLTGRKGRAHANGADAPRTPKPQWCGSCDETTRQTGDPPRRCPECHPLAAELAEQEHT
jgi:hypothetical protein